MARVLMNLVSVVVVLALRARAAGYWALVYGCCALCAAAALLKLCWSFVLRPSTTFSWGLREAPPACLNDTCWGTHCYVRIKVRDARALQDTLTDIVFLGSRAPPHLHPQHRDERTGRVCSGLTV